MIGRRSITAFLVLLYLLGAIALAVRPIRTTLQLGYQGILYKGGDESQYIMRIDQAMEHPFTDVSNPIVTGPGTAPGLQMSFLEMAAGSLLSWVPLTPPALSILLSVLSAPLVIPLLYLLARALGIGQGLSLIGSIIFFSLFLGPLSRVVHQSWSFPFTVATLLVLVHWRQRPTVPWSMLLGLLLGLLPGIYLWHWEFVWCTAALMIAGAVIVLARRSSWPALSSFLRMTLLTAAVTLLVAEPFLLLMVVNAHHPAAAEAMLRSSLLHAREFESIPRSAALAAFTFLAIVSLWRTRNHSATVPLAAFVSTAFLVLHQQFIHGFVLSFWTHEYPAVCLIALLTALHFLGGCRWRGIFPLGTIAIACVFLLAAFFDYGGRVYAFSTLPEWDRYQHLASAIDVIRHEQHPTVLSDPTTSMIVGTYTDADLAFTPYLRHTLISSAEFADRYCLTELFSPTPNIRLLAEETEERSKAGLAETQRAFDRLLALTEAACTRERAHPKDALRRYGVTQMLWDERNNPDWRLPSNGALIPVSRGDGWSLWSIR